MITIVTTLFIVAQLHLFCLRLCSNCYVFVFIRFNMDSFCLFTLLRVNLKTLRKRRGVHIAPLRMKEKMTRKRFHSFSLSSISLTLSKLSLSLNLGSFELTLFASVRLRLIKQTRQKILPKWTAARSSEHLVELLLSLAFSNHPFSVFTLRCAFPKIYVSEVRFPKSPFL